MVGESANQKNAEDVSKWTTKHIYILAILIRLVLVSYARIHDYFFQLPFTDIDYHVFSDAAKLVWQGRSPFDREAYRYTPIIAWMLVPNVFLPDFGKLLFCAADILTGLVQFRIMLMLPTATKNSTSFLSSPLAVISLIWLFNPIIATISARGSADSLVSLLVLTSLYLLQAGYLVPAAIIHGFATHFKLYPVIYLPSIFISLAKLDHYNSTSPSATKYSFFFIRRLITNVNGFIFILVSLLIFFITLAIFYITYGDQFLNEYLFYHANRIDFRHNFSPYFYAFYQTMEKPQLATLLARIAFVPQLLCILLFAFKYHNDLPFCWFLTTYSFVSLNKVCTSQYFLWYICLAPFVRTTQGKAVKLFSLWFFGQGVWLLLAYLLEYRGIRWTYRLLWLSSVFFLFTNFYSMTILIADKENQPVQNKSSEKRKKLH